jgi:uncharacterized membrane protein
MNHPIHAIFVHFPAGLIPVAVFFFLIFLYTKRAIFERISITLLGFSSIFLVLTVITGLLDWNDRYLFMFFPIIIIKIFFSIIALLIIVLIWSIRNKYSKNNNISSLSKTYGYILLNLILFPVIAVIAYFGSYLVYPVEVNNQGDSVRIGSAIYNKNCSSCHPYGQGIFDPLLFPGSSSNFGSASILHSKFISDKVVMLNYIRNPKRMPVVGVDKLSDADFDYIFKYLNYLKNGMSEEEIIDTIKIGTTIFKKFCSGCHKDSQLDKVVKDKSILSSKVFKTDTTFIEFLRKNTNRIKTLEMPIFDSVQISDSKVIILYNFLTTKRNNR